MEIYKKLQRIQYELKVGKEQFNQFGNYKYRSAEDILEALKPLLNKNNTVLILSDSIEQVGDRIYIKAVAILFDAENGDKIENQALARECESKKGMSEDQVTGTASSYARKYALNGLFAIDDTKDSDTMDNSEPKKVIAKPVEEVKAPETFKCVGCGASVPEKVKSYSLSKHSKILCMGCQSKK